MNSLDLFLQGFILLSGVAGQILVANMRKEGFYCWLVSNIALIYISVGSHLWGMTALYIFYSLMCGYAVRRWSIMAVKINAK
jgi:nicotinamide riboside transporter PnuC